MSQADDQTETDASKEALRIAEQKIQLEADTRVRDSIIEVGQSTDPRTDPDKDINVDPAKAPEPAV